MKTIGYIFVCLLGLFLSFSIGRNSVEPSNEPTVAPPDTVKIETVKIVVDTQYVDKPVPYEVKVKDTLYIRDTLLLLELKRYTDNETYDLQISGVDAELDWIKTFPKTVYRDVVTTQNIYIQSKNKKWNIYAGVTISIMENVNAMNLCGGISYTKDRWMIDAQVGREVLRGDNYVKVGGRYNFVMF